MNRLRTFTLVLTGALLALVLVIGSLSSLDAVTAAPAPGSEAVNLNSEPALIPQAQATRDKLTLNFLDRTGITETLVTPSALTMAFANDGLTWLDVQNLATETAVITIETPATVGGLPVGDLTVTIPATTTYKVGPFLGSLFNRKATPDKGYVYIEFPVTSTLQVGAFSIGGQ